VSRQSFAATAAGWHIANKSPYRFVLFLQSTRISDDVSLALMSEATPWFLAERCNLIATSSYCHDNVVYRLSVSLTQAYCDKTTE